MIRTFVLNGNTYPVKDMGVNMLCDFEEMDISMGDMQKKSMSFIRAYIAMCMKETPEKAGREIELHLVNGGTLDEIMEVIKTAMEESDFFQALQKDKGEEATEDKKAKKQ